MKGVQQLWNGTTIPMIGFGTYKITEKGAAYEAVTKALMAGYRHIDTAAFYENEGEVGQAVRDFVASGQADREDLFITSKVWKTENRYDLVMKSFDHTMQRLGLEYLDLYLVHWPSSPSFDKQWETTNQEVWRAMIDLYKSGRVKAIGVSNFLPHHLDTIMDMEVIPMVDQIEINPGFMQQDTIDYCIAHDIRIEAWSPLGRGRSLAHPLIQELAATYGKSAAQIILRWELQHDIIVLPKSVKEERIIENKAIWDFALTPGDMARMDALAPYGNSGHSPD